MGLSMEKCIAVIDRYLDRDESSPRFVNVNHPDQLNQLISHYNVGKNKFLSAEQYSKHDEKVQLDKLLYDLSVLNGNVFLTGFTTYWKLEGEIELTQQLRKMTDKTSANHLVVLCYQCKTQLSFHDARWDRLVYLVEEGVQAVQPKIQFVRNAIALSEDYTVVDGIEELPAAIERQRGGCIACITTKDKSVFSRSLYQIGQETSAFDTLCRLDAATLALSPELGSAEQWNYALELVGQEKSWLGAFEKVFQTYHNLDLCIEYLTGMDEKSDWLYLIALKLLGVQNNSYLKGIVQGAMTFPQLMHESVWNILGYECSDSQFWNVYEERKSLLRKLDVPEHEILDFCTMIPSKGRNALYYLTDQTDIEKYQMFEILAAFSEGYTGQELQEIFQHTYPDLYAYLYPFDFKDDLLNNYFHQYTYQKVRNKILPEFESIVEEQAQKRQYNLLPPRSSLLESIPVERTCAYFMDAMGVEYLGFIQQKCRQMDMVANVSVCRAEIPTITERNKEFLEYFDQKQIPWISVKALDEVKHGGVLDYNYELSPYPFHLVRELEEIAKVLNQARGSLIKGKYDRVVLISDHGASRLAVIKQKTWNVDVNSKGTHGGRVCAYTDDITEISNAIPSDDCQYYVLADYNRFKGGRKAAVETHGGATLEEVAVPIIVLSVRPRDIEIIVETPLEVDSKHPAIVQFYSSTHLDNISVLIDGKKCQASFIDEHKFSVTMAKRPKAGMHTADIYMDNNLIMEGLVFEVKKKGMKEHDLL